ncbi:RHS repeat domain-containing protein [Flavobacterium lindanitolerans]|uniref:RHS repeat domain-containing protein n=1 Tax=Flavobacterium lindanitolerans TaxID=428988 RepID=UPI0023F35508|nr:RHS repeat-associated core domain-containing protein [Flavobacterium lindanitolerans]
MEKKLPGKQWEFIVYDSLDRVIATGPALSPFSDMPGTLGWLFTKYDVFGRVAYTGWMQASVTSAERNTLQAARNAQVSNLSEAKTTSDNSVNGVAFRYTNQAWPSGSGWHVLTVNYYDDYAFPGAPAAFPDVEGQPVYYNLTVKPKGLPTGSWTRVPETSTAAAGETSYILYDYKDRPIRSRISNYLGGYTQTDTKLDFSGKTLYTVAQHKRTDADAPLTVREDFTYSSQDRLLSRTHKVNSNPAELLSLNIYDELGQLISKKTGGQDLSGNSPFQKVDYAYTVRGWLKGINDTGTLSKPGDPLDLFAFRINYDKVENTTGYEVKPLYNGNIAETFWRAASDNYLRSYDHAYDAMNRLTRSFYQKEGLATHSYNEDVQYDRNGNIKGLQRNGASDGSFAQGIDILTYTYDPQKPNMLRKVMDASLSPQGFRDDSDGITDPVDDYAYDDFGNMTADQNKGITGISYNQFSLPTKILFGSESQKIEYLYTAGGKKVRKNISHWNYLETALVDYLDGFQYRDGRLQFFPTSEGYVRVADLGGIYAYSYVYNYTDHLGNIRLSYAMDPQSPNGLKILEENHYYPFGLKHTNYNSNVLVHREDAGALKIKDPDFPKPSAPILPYNYKYNGKEFQDEMGMNWYDYGARNYDPAIGRWMNTDPLAEKYKRWTPYNYAMDNPVRFIDPDGKRIKIGKNYYSYVENRDYDSIKDDFEKQTYQALDFLYSSKAMEVKIVDGENSVTVNILDKLINDQNNIIKVKKGESSGYNFKKNILTFNPLQAVAFFLDANNPYSTGSKGETIWNYGKNSPASVLAHELIHGYNDLFDKNVSNRLNDRSTMGQITDPYGRDFSFSNAEEKYTTSLANQVNEHLKEDQRTNYAIIPYSVKNPTTIQPTTSIPRL